MALFRRKKEEFRPDSTRPALAQRLYIPPQLRRRYLQWFLYGLLCVILLILQDVIFSRFHIRQGHFDVLPCAMLMICVIQGAEAGGIFALVASLFYYLSGSAPGVYVILFLPLLGTVVAAFRQGYMRRGFRPVLVCTAAAVAAYELLVFLAGIVLGVARLNRVMVVLMTAGLSVLTLPLIFPVVQGIAKIGGDTWKE